MSATPANPTSEDEYWDREYAKVKLETPDPDDRKLLSTPSAGPWPPR